MNLATKIKDFLKNLLQKVREVYKKLSPDSYEGKYVREMRDSLSELHGKWIQGIKNATENLNNAKTGATKNTAKNDGVKMQYKGLNKDGIEVYETSERMKGLTYKEKIEVFKRNFYEENSPHYLGTYIKFEHDGHIDLAVIDRTTSKENTRKLNPNRLNQWDKAKINIGAEGDFVTLLENTLYDHRSKNLNRAKNDAHKRASYFEYYLKTVCIDTVKYDVVVNVGLEDNGERFVYDVNLKKIKDSQPGSQMTQSYKNNDVNRRPKVEETTRISESFDSNISQDSSYVNNNSMQKDSKNSLRDNEYLKAVKNGDIETAQRMVDEAAKEAGYTIKAYHGTKSFGFTKFDLSEARDAKAFFLTDSEGIATSYSGLHGTREVSDAFTDSLDGMTAKQLVNELNKKEYVTSDTPYINYYLYNNDLIVRDLFGGYVKTVIDVEQAKSDLIKKRSKGNYALYIKPDNMLTIDCKGVEYDEITGWNEENLKQKGTTDDVARYAYENSYDSVAMENLIDNGGLNDKLKAGVTTTVYSVFNPVSLKSADPVTYDDNGDVIPLSERFNEKNEDIRYSTRGANLYNALSESEWSSFYASVEKSNQRGAFRIGNNGILIPDENNSSNYKLVYYSGDFINPDIYAVYKLENYDYNIHSEQINVCQIIIELMEGGCNEKQTRAILQNYTSMYGTIFKRYNRKSGRFIKLTRESVQDRGNVERQSDREEIPRDAEQGVSELESKTLYQARPDFSDILFDEFDGEVTDNDARLITEYIDGNADTISHILNNTKSITLSEHKVKFFA